MSHENSDPLFIQPKTAEITTNAPPQQEPMMQPQDEQMLGQPQTTTNVVEEAEMGVLNIGQYLEEENEKKKNQNAKPKEEIAEPKEENALKEQDLTMQEKLEEEKFMRQQKKNAVENNPQLQESGKAKFEKGINSRPGACERGRRNKQVSKARTRLGTDKGVTHLTNKIVDKVDDYQKSETARQEDAKIKMEPYSARQREADLKSQEAAIARAKRKGRPIPEFKKAPEGFSEKENLIMKLTNWIPIDQGIYLKSSNPATRAVILKLLIDRSISVNLDPNMVSSVALADNYANVCNSSRNIGAVEELLNKDKEAAALLDGQKLELFKNTAVMASTMKEGLVDGLKLNGLNENGTSCYNNESNEDTEKDQKVTAAKWMNKNNTLNNTSTIYAQKKTEYLEQSEKNWEKHMEVSKRMVDPSEITNKKRVSIARENVDTASVNMEDSRNAYQAQRTETSMKLRVRPGYVTVSHITQEIITTLAPKNANQEQLEEHINQFRDVNIPETTKKYTMELMQTQFPQNLFVYEKMGAPGALQEVLEFRDKVDACVGVSKIKPEVLKSAPKTVRDSVASAETLVKVIDAQIKFFESLYHVSPKGTTSDERIHNADAYQANIKTYEKHVNKFNQNAAQSQGGW